MEKKPGIAGQPPTAPMGGGFTPARGQGLPFGARSGLPGPCAGARRAQGKVGTGFPGQCAGLMNVPLFRSFMAWRSSAWVFITMGPCQATGSAIGAPEISRNRTPSGPA